MELSVAVVEEVELLRAKVHHLIKALENASLLEKSKKQECINVMEEITYLDSSSYCDSRYNKIESHISQLKEQYAEDDKKIAELMETRSIQLEKYHAALKIVETQNIQKIKLTEILDSAKALDTSHPVVKLSTQQHDINHDITELHNQIQEELLALKEYTSDAFVIGQKQQAYAERGKEKLRVLERVFNEKKEEADSVARLQVHRKQHATRKATLRVTQIKKEGLEEKIKTIHSRIQELQEFKQKTLLKADAYNAITVESAALINHLTETKEKQRITLERLDCEQEDLTAASLVGREQLIYSINVELMLPTHQAFDLGTIYTRNSPDEQSKQDPQKKIASFSGQTSIEQKLSEDCAYPFERPWSFVGAVPRMRAYASEQSYNVASVSASSTACQSDANILRHAATPLYNVNPLSLQQRERAAQQALTNKVSEESSYFKSVQIDSIHNTGGSFRDSYDDVTYYDTDVVNRALDNLFS